MNNNYINYLTANRKSVRTIETYTDYVQKMLKFIGKPDTEITKADLLNWQNSISHLSPSTINLQISAIKSYFGFLFEMEIIDSDPSVKLKKVKNNPKVKPFIGVEDINKMLSVAKSDRNKAIIAMLASTGLRISELKSITLKEYMSNPCQIVITGKGDKQRVVYIPESTQKQINIYLKNRNVESDCLFCSRIGGEIDTSKIDDALKRVAKNAELPYWKDMSAHCLRSAFCSNMLAQNVPVNIVRDMMGHASIATTNIYAKSAQNEIREYMMRGY